MSNCCCHVLVAALVTCVTHAADIAPNDAGAPAIAPAKWSAVCSERAGAYQRYSDNDVAQLQNRLQARLDDLQHSFPFVAHGDEPWHDYLMWNEIHRLAAGDPVNSVSLDDLELRWFNARAAWDADELVAAANAALQCVRARRAASRPETPQQQAAAWKQLAKLLKQPASLTPTERQTVAELLWERARLGQSSPLTASVRRTLSKPNLIVQVNKAWLAAQQTVDVDEPFNSRGVFAGAATTSTGQLTGATNCCFLSSRRGVEWSLNFAGQVKSSSVSHSQATRVESHATTAVSATKQFRVSVTGMTSDPADATASTKLTYDQICAKGLAFRRRIARSRAIARRPIAENDTSKSVRNALGAFLDDTGLEATQSFNRTYFSFRDRFACADRMVPQVRIRVDDVWLNWESRLEGRGGFAAPQNAPLFDTTAPLIVHIAAGALEEYAVAILGKKRLSAEELAAAIGKTLATDGGAESMGEPFEVEFAERPVQVRLANDHLLLSLFISAFESGGTSYPAMTVDVDYALRLRDGGVAFVPQGKLKVTSPETGTGAGVTGRQQTLRLVARRKLSRVLGAEFLWPGFTFPINDDPNSLRVSKLRADDGWLQLAVTTK